MPEPVGPGTYVLILECAASRTIRVGRLGRHPGLATIRRLAGDAAIERIGIRRSHV